MNRKFFLTLMVCFLVMSQSFTIFAAASDLEFTTVIEEKDNLPEAQAEAVPAINVPKPYINKDGTFEFRTSGNGVGKTLVSSSFKFSATSSKITIDAGGSPDSYTVYLEKQVILGVWSTVKTVTYYTGGVYEYTFTDLSTSAKYRLRFYSEDEEVHGSGTISNYAG